MAVLVLTEALARRFCQTQFSAALILFTFEQSFPKISRITAIWPYFYERRNEFLVAFENNLNMFVAAAFMTLAHYSEVLHLIPSNFESVVTEVPNTAELQSRKALTEM